MKALLFRLIQEGYWLDSVLEVQEGEAFALLSNLRWMEELPCQEVILETDCRGMVDQLDSGRNNISECGILLNHIRQLLNLHPRFSYKFVSRRANSMAHNLAHYSRENPNYKFSFHHVLSCIQTIISMEMS